MHHSNASINASAWIVSFLCVAVHVAGLENGYRLPASVVPKNYHLLLNPHIGTGGQTFNGELTITVDIVNTTQIITLHTNKLDYSLISLSGSAGAIAATHELIEEDKELLIVRPGTSLTNGEYTLHFVYSGHLDDGLVGFYASTSNQSIMAASKFQPTYARQAFPCFDEPELKATYDISLVKPSDYIALSNMNQISSTPNPGTESDTVTFATSVPMSTYLACFVVCNYEYEAQTINTNGIGNPFELRCYARDTGKISFALDIGKRATEFYIQYYQVPYPLPKLDMIAIPDYVSGATEHWGLITYRETSFLIDNETASASNKISVASTIAHELAHMWFGNLVTMKWWDEVWLNEGFATYMQFKALNAIEPSWTMLEQFLTKTLHPVLVTDSKLSSHQIVQTVDTPDEITAIFDAISYNKGASILRMLEGFIGASNFQQGVTDYLNKHMFGNTVTQDLLDSLEQYFQNDNNLELKHILDTWTQQMGYPLVTVANGPEPYTYILTQSRFLADPNALANDTSPFNYRWCIPITYKTMSSTHDEVLWFEDNADSLTITLSEEDFWLKINNDQVGYYRVNYPQSVWMSLVNQLQTQSDRLSISDRAHLLNDVYELASARVISYELALQFVTYMPFEREYVPWSAAAVIFTQLANKLLYSDALDNFRTFVQTLVTPIYRTMSWERQNDLTIIQSLLRTEVLSVACAHGLDDARQKTRQMFLAWLSNHGSEQPVSVEPDLRQIVYYNGMRLATAEEWERLWQVYLAETDAQERSKLMSALAAPDDVALLTRYLNLSWEESNVRGQDYLTVVSYISANPAGTALAWDYVRSHWQQYVERFTLNSRYLGALVPSVTAAFSTQDRLQEMEDFFAAFPDAGAGESARRRALETVRNNIQWSQHNEAIVESWLENYLAASRASKQ